jgi:cytochrome d ubiquinol oxidase subunit I
MDVLLLSRIQFAVTIMFHYIYPPLSIGLSVLLVGSYGMFLKTRDEAWERWGNFLLKLFAVTFALGVATGIVMEFEFGTNWATYSRYVGDVFGSPLAAEGIFAFFLESSFLGVLLFGRKKFGAGMHFLSAVAVAAGAHLSAVWIVVANSWMQTPAGYQIVTEGSKTRAHITDFWAMVFNPSSIDRIIHVLGGCWLAGATVGLAAAAWFLLNRQHVELAKKGLKLGLAVTAFAALFQLFTGHASAIGVSKNQPEKLAAYEGHYAEKAPMTLSFFGWVDEKNERVIGIGLPGMVGVLVSGNLKQEFPGLKSFKKEDLPPVQLVFQTYHAMVGIGMTLIGVSLLGLLLWWKGWVFDFKPLLLAFVALPLLPQLANQLGWIAAEVGRQPWIVYHLLRTSDALSKTVKAEAVLTSLILFTIVYFFLLLVFLYMMVKKVLRGPDPEPQQP